VTRRTAAFARSPGQGPHASNALIVWHLHPRGRRRAAAETELERSGITVRRGSAAAARSRQVREFIAFDDPFGNRIELVSH
jgi:hypothetical protein